MKTTAIPVRFKQVFANLDKALDGAKFVSSSADPFSPGQTAENMRDTSSDLFKAAIAVVNAFGEEASQHVSQPYDADPVDACTEGLSDAWAEICIGIDDLADAEPSDAMMRRYHGTY